MAADPGLPPGSIIGGIYKIRRLIGQGGMGEVYAAEGRGGEKIALKVLHERAAQDPDLVARFNREANIAKQIHSPFVAAILGAGKEKDGRLWIAFERLVGEGLDERLRREQYLSFAEVAPIVEDALTGLSAAHNAHVVHRDIKPANLFIEKRRLTPEEIAQGDHEERTRILDFGVSKMLSRPTSRGLDFDDETLTKTGMVMGTPYYMAPEQARGERDLDGRVDIYACGVVLYEILTGKRPFQGTNYNALLMGILTSTPTPLRSLEPSVVPALERVVQKAMSRSRKDRYADARALRDALVLVTQQPIRAKSDSIDIPINFVDSAEVDLHRLDEDNGTTTARRAPRLEDDPSSDDAYGEEAVDRTTLMTPAEIAHAVPGVPRERSVHDADPNEMPANEDDATRTVPRDTISKAKDRKK